MRLLAWRLPVVLCTVGLLTGCGDPAAGDGSLVLGTGETAFEPVEPGEELTLVAGSQGGYHFWLSFEVEGLSGPRVQMQLEMTSQATGRTTLSDVRIGVSSIPDRPGVSDYIGWPARVFDPWCAVGEPVTVEVRLEDREGRVARATTEVVPLAPPGGFDRACEEGA